MRTQPTLVVLAAGLGTRYGGLKQLTPVGPRGEALLDYGVYDAARAGFGRVVFVVRQEVEELFRRHVATVIGDAMDVAYAQQTLDPSPPGRTKPWGTGHAVLAAAPQITAGRPFAVMNADDFYGPVAYRMLFEHLTSAGPEKGEHTLIGYPLAMTLSPHGGVSRAIAETDGRGYLSRLTEVTDIAPGGSGFTGRTAAGQAVAVSGEELVSMNLWGFTPAVLFALGRQFGRFLELWGADPAAEFLLSEAVGAQVAEGEARVRVLRTSERWLGVTFSADDEAVRAELARLVEAGLYPANLKAGFERLCG
ncbi:MAG TPA: NTP transferase domain-containing protein [Gemmatimonadales bacterium]|nr:NTP transferase domain-containing protein [Gemmatimonadales bacterium]